MVFQALISFILMSLSFILLMLHLRTERKNHFLMSMTLILVSSTYVVFSVYSVITLLFFLAALFSIIGDLFMARKVKLTENRTIDGAIFFGIAHICYLIAFIQLRGSLPHIFLLFGGLIVAFVVYFGILHNPELNLMIKIVNISYAILIMQFFITVIAFILVPGVDFSIRIASLFGVILFILSDSVLAYNEFKSSLPWASKLIATTYIVAQILLQTTPVVVITSY